MLKNLSVALLLAIFALPIAAEELEDHDGMLMDHGDGHLMDMGGGMVMGQNAETLPGGCDSISETKEITVHAGHKYAEKFPGRMFAFDTQEFNFKPCTKLTVHFINEDHIRHQWMMHGLPKYLYPKGMFHLEVSGPGKISGTLILPPGDRTYLVHCDIAQHMEKGMKAQLKVGKGDGDFPSIPGVTAYAITDDYRATLPEIEAKAKAAEKAALAQPIPPAPKPADANAVASTSNAAKSADAANAANSEPLISGVTLIGLAIGLIMGPFLSKYYQGMTIAEGIAFTFSKIRVFIDLIIKLITFFIPKKNKELPADK